MPKPVCVPCQRFYYPKKNGVYVEERMPISLAAKSGTEEPHLWDPYKIWNGDQWICKGCGSEIVTGFGNGPVTEQHQTERYAQFVPYITVIVNDC